MPTEQKSFENYKKFADEMDIKYYESIEKALEEKSPKIATGRKAGKNKNTPIQSLKVHSWKTKLEAKRQEINEVERILDERKDFKHSLLGNAAIFYLYPRMNHLYEEAILLDNLKKIQHK